MDKPTRPMIFEILPDILPRASQIDLPEQKTKHTPKGRILFPMKKPTRTLIFEILPDILPTAILVYLFFMMLQKISGMILAFLPIMPIIDVEKVEAKIRRQRLGIHGEDSDSEFEDEKWDIASSENPTPDNTQNRGGTATKGGGGFGGGGGTNRKGTGTNGPKNQKGTKDRKNPKDNSLWKKLWDWLFG